MYVYIYIYIYIYPFPPCPAPSRAPPSKSMKLAATPRSPPLHSSPASPALSLRWLPSRPRSGPIVQSAENCNRTTLTERPVIDNM